MSSITIYYLLLIFTSIPKYLPHISLNSYYNLYFFIYDNTGKHPKIIPTNIGELFTPRALVYWIMEDS